MEGKMNVKLESLLNLDRIVKELKRDGLLYVSYVGIVDTPNGVKKFCEIQGFDHEYYEQKTGYCNDEYYGNFYLPIEGKYMKFYYAA
jgi:hypothetical protein